MIYICWNYKIHIDMKWKGSLWSVVSLTIVKRNLLEINVGHYNEVQFNRVYPWSWLPQTQDPWRRVPTSWYSQDTGSSSQSSTNWASSKSHICSHTTTYHLHRISATWKYRCELQTNLVTHGTAAKWKNETKNMYCIKYDLKDGTKKKWICRNSNSCPP